MRLQEIHPAVVHYPLALLPVAVGADLLGEIAGSRRLSEIGRALMPVAAASAALSAATGLVAQEEVVADGVAHDVLVTHRNLNLSLVTLSTALAVWRWRRETPGSGYFALALAGLGAMAYSAYLGGKLVYEHGVGVVAAGGVRADTPAVAPGRAGELARRVGRDIERGVGHALDDLRKGDPLPAIGRAAAPSADVLGAVGPGAPESMP